MGVGTTREFVAFDLETTGLSARLDRIVEVGAVRFDDRGRELGRYSRLVNPGCPMPARVRAIHGISDADLEDEPAASVVLPDFLDFLGDPRTTTLLAHHASFDAGFLGSELDRMGREMPSHEVIDTLAMARRLLPELPNHRLDTLARHFDLDPEGPHRALADSLRVKGLWLALQGQAADASERVAYSIVIPGDSAPVPNGWDAIVEAIARGDTVRMRYTGGTRGDSARELTPRAFDLRGGVPYLIGRCHLDAKVKSFRLDRVVWYEVVRIPTTIEIVLPLDSSTGSNENDSVGDDWRHRRGANHERADHR